MPDSLRFPYVEIDSSLGAASALPYVPITLERDGNVANVSALVDSGAALSVLPHDVGIQLRAVWEQQRFRYNWLVISPIPMREQSTVGGVAALDLNTHLGDFFRPWLVTRVGMDADQVVALVVWRGLVGEDVAAHQIAHDEELGTCGNDRQSEPVSVGHYNL